MAGDVRVEQLGLSSQASVLEFAERWEGPLDLLVNKAGVMNPRTYRAAEDGHELMFGTNHLGHSALTGRLLPALLEAPAPRLVTVASIAHHGGNAKVLLASPEEKDVPERHYGNSKLVNVLFLRELRDRAVAAGSKLASTGAPRHLGDQPGGLARRHGCQPAGAFSRRRTSCR